MTTNNYVWEKDLSLNDLVLKQKEEIERLNEKIDKALEKINDYKIYCKKKIKDLLNTLTLK